MADPITRRDALVKLGASGVGLFMVDGIIRGQDAAIRIAGQAVEIAVSSVSPSTVRITVLPIEGNGTMPVPDDGALVQEQWGRSLANARSAASLRSVRAGDLVVRYTAGPPTIHVETAEGKTVQTLAFDPEGSDVSFRLPDGPLYGMGEGGPQFDRKGSTYRNRNGQGGYQLRTHGGRVSIQWLVGTDGWGMYIHHPLGSFDLTGERGRITPRPGPFGAGRRGRGGRGGELTVGETLPFDVFVVASDEPPVILAEYARITGIAQMPALWTFGYLQSHRTLAGPEEILSVARTFREKQLPCDGLIYLGTDFCPSGWNTHNGEFTWKPENFSDPKEMIDRLHEQNFKVMLHIVVEGRRMSGTVGDDCVDGPAELHELPSGRDEEDRWPADRHVACYWPAHKPLFDVGVDGWWPDQGDGFDAPSRLARIRMYWEGSQMWRPNERPFALHRNGYCGMQRYGAFLWSGDVYTTWETLATHLPVAVNTSLSGIPFWGTDIGGFVPTAEYTGELHVRWFQFGAFCPLFRSHGRTWHLRLPWGWNTGELGVSEVTNYRGGAADPEVSELDNPDVEPICRKYLELRYRLMPYLYSAVWECSQTGLPIMRALWLHYPDDPRAVERGDEFLWGRDMLVAPVVEQGATTRSLYLPRGDWYDFWTEEKLEGSREIERQVDLETMPLYVRAGAILPMGPVKQYTGEAVDGPLTLLVYPGADGTFTLYEDDGHSFDYRNGEWMGIAMRWQDEERRLSLALVPGSKMLPPEQRTIEVRLAGTDAVTSVTFEGEPVELSL